jgi:hypothetical protein
MEQGRQKKQDGFMGAVKFLLVLSPLCWLATIYYAMKKDSVHVFEGMERVLFNGGWILDLLLYLLGCALLWRGLGLARINGFFDDGFIKALSRIRWLILLSMVDEVILFVYQNIPSALPHRILAGAMVGPLWGSVTLWLGVWALIKVLRTGRFLAEEQQWMV